jgi:hypothetical protein
MKSLLVTFVFTAAATVVSAQLANSSFETGDFTGWTASGDGAHVYSSAEGDLTAIAPLDGTFYAALLPHSSILQATGIHLRAGEKVSAWMNGTESGEGSLDLILDSGAIFSVPWTPFFEPGSMFPVRWNQISFKIQQDGIYSIGASNPGLYEGPFSFFGVDLFTITPVPESSSYGLLAAVLGVAAIMWRRRKASAAAAT